MGSPSTLGVSTPGTSAPPASGPSSPGTARDFSQALADELQSRRNEEGWPAGNPGPGRPAGESAPAGGAAAEHPLLRAGPGDLPIRFVNGGDGQGAPGADTRETAPAGQHDASNASQKPQMPSVVTALGQGIWHGGRDLAQTGTALGGGRPDAEAQSSAAAAPLQWSDLLSPGTVLAPKLAYQFGESSPTMAGGAVGAFLGTLAAGGPEDPLSALTGLAGGALGAGLMSGLQSFGNYFGDELSKTPGDPDGAYGRARQRAEAAGAFSGAAWAAFPARAFAGPLKNSMFQTFGVQPTINMGHQAADNALTGKPLADGLGNAYTQGALGTLPVAGGHFVGGEAGRVASQYELQVDPTALGANGGNVRIVPKPARTSLTSSEAVISKDPFPTHTRPAGGSGELGGEPEAIERRSNDVKKYGIRIQNKSLRMAADAGYRVVQQPGKTLGRDGKPLLTKAQQESLGLDPGKNPDALINGRVFDVYGPISPDVESVHNGINKKVGTDQAHRILVNLSETEVTPSQLRQYLQNNPIANLKEIILIDQSGNIKNFFPFSE